MLYTSNTVKLYKGKLLMFNDCAVISLLVLLKKKKNPKVMFTLFFVFITSDFHRMNGMLFDEHLINFMNLSNFFRVIIVVKCVPEFFLAKDHFHGYTKICLTYVMYKIIVFPIAFIRSENNLN